MYHPNPKRRAKRWRRKAIRLGPAVHHFAREIFIESDIPERICCLVRCPFTKRSVPLEITGARDESSNRTITRIVLSSPERGDRAGFEFSRPRVITMVQQFFPLFIPASYFLRPSSPAAAETFTHERDTRL